MIKLEILYKPESELTKVDIFGVQYSKISHGPNVYVVKKIDYKDREKTLSFTENGETHHLLHHCIYRDIDGYVHIECRFWSEEIIEED
jgi:hypothetical protein